MDTVDNGEIVVNYTINARILTWHETWKLKVRGRLVTSYSTITHGSLVYIIALCTTISG